MNKSGSSPLLNVVAYWKSDNTETYAKKLSQILPNNANNRGRVGGLRIPRYCRKVILSVLLNTSFISVRLKARLIMSTELFMEQLGLEQCFWAFENSSSEYSQGAGFSRNGSTSIKIFRRINVFFISNDMKSFMKSEHSVI